MSYVMELGRAFGKQQWGEEEAKGKGLIEQVRAQICLETLIKKLQARRLLRLGRRLRSIGFV